nr:MAG: putative capsid protein [Permutotetraviridae sp.]
MRPNKVKLGQYKIAVPFEVANIGVYTTAVTNPMLCTVGLVATTGELDLHPVANDTATQNKMFGPELATLAGAFTMWRLSKLKVEYVPLCATTASGGLAFGYTREPLNTGALTFGNVAGCQESMQTAVWEPNSMTIDRTLDKTWKYVTVLNPTGAEQRQDFPGALLIAAPAALGPNAFYGLVRFSGVIEFQGLADQITLQSRPPLPISSERNPPLPLRSTCLSPPPISIHEEYVNLGTSAACSTCK